MGEAAVDIDSLANTDLTDDRLVDDEIDDDGTADEDDHDITTVHVEKFDLALRKTLANGQASTVEPGDDVDFTISVFNQGEVDAQNIEVTDTLPAGTTLDDPNWTDNGDGTATRTLAGPVTAGDQASMTITLKIDRPVTRARSPTPPRSPEPPTSRASPAPMRTAPLTPMRPTTSSPMTRST